MEITTTLLEYGASTNTVTRQGITPLHLAAQEGNVDIVTLLLARDAPINVGNKVRELLVKRRRRLSLCRCLRGRRYSQHGSNIYAVFDFTMNFSFMAWALLQTLVSLSSRQFFRFSVWNICTEFLYCVYFILSVFLFSNSLCGCRLVFSCNQSVWCTGLSSLSLHVFNSVYLTVCPQSSLTPLHLAAQEDKVNIAEVLVNHGATIDPETKVTLLVSSCLWVKLIKKFIKQKC